MAIKLVSKDTTSLILELKLYDSTSSVGAGKTALIHSDITATYHRNSSSGTGTSITMATMTLGTYTSGGFKKVNDATMPGVYQFCPPDACLASGADSVTMTLTASGMVQCDVEIQLNASWAGGEVDGVVVAYAANATSGLHDVTLAATEPAGTNTMRGGLVVFPASKQWGKIRVWNGTTKKATIPSLANALSGGESYFVIPGDPEIVETVGSYTSQQVMSLLLAVLGGTSPSAGVFKTPDASTTRVSGTVDNLGVRSAITLTPSS